MEYMAAPRPRLSVSRISQRKTWDTRGYPSRSLARIRQVIWWPVARRPKPRKKTAVSIRRDFFLPMASLRKPAKKADTR